MKPIPRPSLFSLLLASLALPAGAFAATTTWNGGSGTWDTATANWSSGVWVNANNDTAAFSGTAGTVTVDAGGVGLAGLAFGTSGYTVSGGPLGFGANSGVLDTASLGVAANGSVVTVASNLTGSNGLAITAHSAAAGSGNSGRLTLSGDNTGLTGGIAINSGVVKFSSQNAAGNGPLTLNGGGIITVADDGLSGQNLTLANAVTLGASGGFVRTTYSGNLTLSGVVSGAGGFSKYDGGTVTLTGANTYAGTTSIFGGTLAMGSGASLNSAGSVVFSGNGTFALGANSQTLANLSFSANATGTVTGTGTLTLTGATAFNPFGYSNVAASTLNMAGLDSFVYGSPVSASAFTVGRLSASTSTATTTVLTLASGTNTIGTSAFSVGTAATTTSQNLAAPLSTAIVNLGGTNTINTGAFNVAAASASAKVFFRTGLTGTPALVIRGVDGVSAAGSLTVGGAGSNYRPTVGLLDLTGTSGDANATGVAGTLDANVGTVLIGAATGLQAPATGTLLMGAGNLRATSITLGQLAAGTGTQYATRNATGTLSVTGGTITVGALTLGDRQSSAVIANANATFILAGGGTLAAQTVQAGANGGATGTVTRTFAWNDGTIRNYDASTDLAIGSGLTLTLAASGTHAFNIDAGRTGTVNAVIAEAAAGGALTKSGLGSLKLAAANTFSGGLNVTGGKVITANAAALGTGAVNVLSGATLTLGDGTTNTVTLGSGANLAVAGILQLASTGSAITLAGGSYDFTGATLDLNHLFDGVSGTQQYTLITGFGSKTDGAVLTGFNAGAVSASFANGVLTVSAIPEPSAYGLSGAGALAGIALLRRRNKRTA